MAVEEFEEKIFRTWIHLLLDSNYRELAALIVDGKLSIDQTQWGNSSPQLENIFIDLPTSAYSIIMTNTLFQEALIKSLALVTKGYVHTQDKAENVPISFRVKLIEVEENWIQKVKNLIINSKGSNQGLITEKVFSRRGEQSLLYNEMKFASRSEIRIAQELEERKVLFFPLPLAVRSDTGALYEDHREPDFLVCQDGVWGILEVAYHPDRYEKDSEKDVWFKKSGILCTQHYTAERCYNHPSEVVDEFLQILAKHKK
jgi:hypothetical protein